MKTLIFIYVFLMGCVFGSFVNVLIFRLPHKKKLFWDRSACMSCHHPLAFWEMIPVVSYLILKGKCHHCHESISVQYPLTELFSGILALTIYVRFGLTMHTFCFFIFSEMLLALSIMDMRWMAVADRLLIVSAVFALIDSVFDPLPFWIRIQGMIMIPLLLYLINCIKTAFGEGDLYLLMIGGYLLGVPKNLIAFVISLFSASIYALFLLAVKKRKLNSYIPFVPFLSIGFFIAFII